MSVKKLGSRVEEPKYFNNIFLYLTWHKKIRKFLKVMGKCVEQVEKWSKW